MRIIFELVTRTPSFGADDSFKTKVKVSNSGKEPSYDTNLMIYSDALLPPPRQLKCSNVPSSNSESQGRNYITFKNDSCLSCSVFVNCSNF
jgi:hypothetical protein